MRLEYSKILKWFRYNCPDQMERLFDSLSPNQIICKEWLIESLDKVQIPRDEHGKFNIEIIGGWFGYPLIDLLYQKYDKEINRIDIFEIDEFACRAINKYNCIFKNWHVRVFHQDYFTYQEKRRTHMIINTSCEHMLPMKWWGPEGPRSKHNYFKAWDGKNHEWPVYKKAWWKSHR